MPVHGKGVQWAPDKWVILIGEKKQEKQRGHRSFWGGERGGQSWRRNKEPPPLTPLWALLLVLKLDKSEDPVALGLHLHLQTTGQSFLQV